MISFLVFFSVPQKKLLLFICPSRTNPYPIVEKLAPMNRVSMSWKPISVRFISIMRKWAKTTNTHTFSFFFFLFLSPFAIRSLLADKEALQQQRKKKEKKMNGVKKRENCAAEFVLRTHKQWLKKMMTMDLSGQPQLYENGIFNSTEKVNSRWLHQVTERRKIIVREFPFFSVFCLRWRLWQRKFSIVENGVKVRRSTLCVCVCVCIVVHWMDAISL